MNFIAIIYAACYITGAWEFVMTGLPFFREITSEINDFESLEKLLIAFTALISPIAFPLLGAWIIIKNITNV